MIVLFQPVFLLFRFVNVKSIKGAVSWQSSSFCFILPITRPKSQWHLT